MAIKRVLLNVVGSSVQPITLDPATGDPVREEPDLVKLDPGDEIEWSVSTGFCVSQIYFRKVIPFGDGGLPACLPAFVSSGEGGIRSGRARLAAVEPEVDIYYDVYVFPEGDPGTMALASRGRGRVRPVRY